MNSKLEKVIKFSGWTPSPNTVTIGMERDNKVFLLKFDGLPEYPNGTAYLHIDCGENGADSIEVVDGTAEIRRNVTQYEGEKEAYVEILADGDVVWHSDVIMVTVKRLPILGEKIEQAYPTAFEQALAQTAADKAAAAKSAADAAATAAGIVTDEAARQDAERKRVAAETARENAEETRAANERLRAGAENKRVKAEAARETAEGKREKAETEREQKTDAAVKRADDLVKSVEAKLENGDFVGEQGPRGPIGETGPQGVPGAQGEKGDKGDTGATGPQGVPGTNGADGAPGKDGRDGLDAPQIDDTTVSDTNPWSSVHIIDVLCPKASVSGNPVVVKDALGGVWLTECKATFTPTQAGTGTPSLDNIRPISGRGSVKVERQEDTQTTTLTLPRTIYGGEVDAQTGEGQEAWKLLTLTGQEKSHIFTTLFYLDLNAPGAYDYTTGTCSHYKYLTYGDGAIGVTAGDDDAAVVYSPVEKYEISEDGLTAWKSYLAAQYAAGTPVQIAYKLATPVSFTATGGSEIKALEGVNTLLTDGDSISATYTQSPAILLKSLQTQASTQSASTAALERAVTDI